MSWNKIWNKKYSKSESYSHINAGFDFLSIVQWKNLVKIFTDLLIIKKDSQILDVGCGEGAFLEQIKQYKSVSGIDLSENAIFKINTKMKVDFKVSQVNNLPFDDNSFDTVICFSIFHYLESINYSKQVINELIRVTKPLGQILIGDINDFDKKELYFSTRIKENRNTLHKVKSVTPDHQFYKKSLFLELAKKNNLKIQIIDESKLDLSFYSNSNSNYRFSVVYNKVN